MAEDPMRAKARTTFGKAFMDAAKPRPLAKDAATASQKVANQRPIPTYKVGGVVKKADGGVMPGRIAARIKAGNYKDGGETFDYNKGGKVGKYANGGILDRVAQAISDIANQDKMKKYGIPKGERPSAPSGSGAQRSGSASGRGNNTPVTVTRREESVTVTPTAAKTQTVTPTAAKTQTVKLNEKPKYVKLNPHKDGGKVQTSADTARKLATEMGGMKKGGACGMKPVKKAVGGTATPLRDASPRTSGLPGTSGVQLAARDVPASPISTARATGPAFDRNQAYQTLNAQARNYLNMGVPKDLIIKQQAALRALQNDPNSTAAQHQQALNRAMGTIIGAMNAAQAAKKAAPASSATPLKDMSAKTSGLPGTSGVQLAAKTPVNRAVGGAGKTRKDQAPIKRAHGGVAKKDTMPREGVSTRPTGPGGRRITFEELEQSNRDTGGMSAEQLRAAGRAIGRGNRTPKEPIPRAKGGAAKVRKGMMSESGNIKQAVKPKKGIGGFM